MNIAVATNDGLKVNEHFGRAKTFHIFEVKKGVLSLLMISELNMPYASEDKLHTFNKEQFDKIANKLKLCTKLYCTKIGDAPAKAFREIGIEPVVYLGAIKDIILGQ